MYICHTIVGNILNLTKWLEWIDAEKEIINDKLEGIEQGTLDEVIESKARTKLVPDSWGSNLKTADCLVISILGQAQQLSIHVYLRSTERSMSWTLEQRTLEIKWGGFEIPGQVIETQ